MVTEASWSSMPPSSSCNFLFLLFDILFSWVILKSLSYIGIIFLTPYNVSFCGATRFNKLSSSYYWFSAWGKTWSWVYLKNNYTPVFSFFFFYLFHPNYHKTPLSISHKGIMKAETSYQQFYRLTFVPSNLTITYLPWPNCHFTGFY